LGSALPAVIQRGRHWDKPAKSAKKAPVAVEGRVFADTSITSYRLAA
jgi:hypothetical protein